MLLLLIKKLLIIIIKKLFMLLSRNYQNLIYDNHGCSANATDIAVSWSLPHHIFQIVAGKLMEQGPVLVISFSAQQIMAVRSSSGAVVEGDPVSVGLQDQKVAYHIIF